MRLRSLISACIDTEANVTAAKSVSSGFEIRATELYSRDAGVPDAGYACTVIGVWSLLYRLLPVG